MQECINFRKGDHPGATPIPPPAAYQRTDPTEPEFEATGNQVDERPGL
jgi:hypothetical protein